MRYTKSLGIKKFHRKHPLHNIKKLQQKYTNYMTHEYIIFDDRRLPMLNIHNSQYSCSNSRDNILSVTQ